MRVDLQSLRAGRRPDKRARGRRVPWRWLVPALALIAGALLPMLAADRIDDWMIERGWRPGEPRLSALQDWTMAMAEVEATELPLLLLDLKFRKYQVLVNKRRQALDNGRLVVGSDDFVTGVIRLGDASVHVEVRLQGSDAQNLEGVKWPLRVHAKRGGHVLGVERFTLRSPEADGYLRKAALYEHLRLAGVAAPRHRFVRLAINGTPLGIMSLEEYFSNELVAGQRRPEGPLLRFGKALLHASEEQAAESDDAEVGAVRLGALDNYRLAPVRVFRARRTLRDPQQRALASRAVGLLRDFAAGRRSAEQVFDVQTIARLLAVCEIWGAGELLQWANLRFYFNPILGRLEPVGYASQSEPPRSDFDLGQRGALTRDLLVSPAVRAAYVRALLTESRRFVQGQAAPVTDKVALWRHQLRAEYPMARLNVALADRAQALLAGHMDPAVMLLAHRRSQFPQRLAIDVIRITNPLLVDVVVSDLRWRIPPPPAAEDQARSTTETASQHLPARLLDGVRLPFHLTSTALDGAPSWREIRLSRPADLPAQAEIEFDVRLASGGDIRQVQSQPELLPGAPTGGSSSGQTPAWLHIADRSAAGVGAADGSTYVIPAGRWRLERPLALPAGWGLRLEAGCELLLGPEASVLVQGPLQARGTAERPVVIRSAAAAGPGSALTVQRGGQVDLRHLHMTGAEPGSGGRGLALYEVKAALLDCRFSGLGAGAAVRAARTTVRMERCVFDDIRGDGVAVEYGVVTLIDVRMAHVGGDGLDISGSKAHVTAAAFERIGDKAVSIGERSEAELVNIRVHGAAIGVAAKDSSRTTIRGARLTAIGLVGLAAFTKKRRFGTARLQATDVQVSGARLPYLAQGGSEVIVDGDAVPASAVALADLAAMATPTAEP